MNDSTTQIVRRQRHIKTTVAGWLFPLSFAMRQIEVLKPYAEMTEAFAGLLLGAAAADASRDGLRSAVHQVKTRIGKLPLPLLAAVLCVGAAAGTGCSTFRSTQRETETATGTNIITVRETTIRARTFWDAKSDLAKLRASTTDKVQGMTIGSIGQESSATNAVNLVESVVRAAVAAAVKP